MDVTKTPDLSVPDNILQPLLVASGFPTLQEALDCLTVTAKIFEGRSDLASKHIVVVVLQLCPSVLCPLHRDLVFSALRLLRNLCAGEIKCQNLFIEQNGVGVLSRIVSSMELASGSDNGILRTLLQVLGNVSLTGEVHQLVIWHQFFAVGFLELARVRSKETCDPLCMVIYTCSQGNNALYAELCSETGLEIMIEIIQTVTIADFREDWLKLLLSRICLEDSCFSLIFSKLLPLVFAEYHDTTVSSVDDFGAEQAFLLSVLSEILNERIADSDTVVSNNFALCILGILRNSVEIIDFTKRGSSNLPTGSANVDVLGYSLTILKDICACPQSNNKDELVLAGLIELLINVLRDLEPPEIIKKVMIQSETKNGISHFSKYCPYKGFRRDIIAIIGNFCYHRKSVQNKVRELDGIVLLLQQCTIDEENPFLREWEIWTMRNILEGNADNLKLVSELELQGTVDVPELTQMGLRVDVDQRTRRAKLVNVS